MRDPAHDPPLSATRRAIVALLAWVAVYGPIGVVMHGIATFLFAFSGGQYRMTPVVNAGFWLVGLSGLIIGVVALVRSWDLSKVLVVMLLCALLAWFIAFAVYWVLSFQLGADRPQVR